MDLLNLIVGISLAGVWTLALLWRELHAREMRRKAHDLWLRQRASDAERAAYREAEVR